MRLRYVLLAAPCAALMVTVMPPVTASGSRADVVMLKKVASNMNDRVGVIAIEASDPAPYVASQPDPQTLVVELREVQVLGFENSVRVGPEHPITAVRVDGTTSTDGVNVARVQMTLAHPMRPRVRSVENVIYVEADRAPLSAPPVEARAVTSPIDAALTAAAAVTLSAPAAPAVVAENLSRQVVPDEIPQPMAQAPAAAAAQQTPAPGGAAQPAAPQRYTGDPVSLDFQGADLRAVLRTFSEISGLNVVIDPTIQGTVDVALRDVPWDQALDVILRANQLGYIIDGTIVRIAPLTALADEESQRRQLAEEQALAGELQVLTRSLSYARAEDLQQLLIETVLSQRGSLQFDARTNTIIINDLQERLEHADALLTTLDRPEPQVEIEARIVQTSRDFARLIGVQWGFNGRASADLGNTIPLAFPNEAGVSGRTGAQSPGAFGEAANVVNLAATGASSALGLALGSINGAVNLDVALSALERQGEGRILSTPRVSTQNNVEAEITQGIQIPIQTVANNTVTVTFKDAALTLLVTPQITASDTVIMRINVENSSPDFSRAVNNIPPIDTQRAITQVLVRDGETTVIGGIYVSREQTIEDRTPGLHRLPLLGWLFKRDGVADESRELLIFITPRISRL